MNEIQKRVADRLASLGAGPAHFYEEACQLVEDVVAGSRELTTVTHVVSHLLREVDSAVRQVLVAHLIDEPPVVSPSPPEALEPGRSVPTSIVGEGGSALSAPTESGDDDCEAESPGFATQIVLILRALGLPEDGPQHQQWRAIGKGPGALNKRAHRDDLNPPRPSDSSFLAMVEGVTQLLDVVLDRFASHYAKVYARLDALLAREQPTRADLRVLKSKIPNTQHTLSYFFQRLQHAGWIDQLQRAGYFRSPPPPEVNQERGTVGFPSWPALDYLARMARAVPERVAEILTAIPDTENMRVRAQVIDALLVLRAEDRQRAVPRVIRWVDALTQHFMGDRAPRFALRLVQDGALDDAFLFTAAILETRSADGTTPPHRLPSYGGERERAWHLREAAESLFPALVDADAERAVHLLALAIDLHVGRRVEDADVPPDVPQGRSDYSTLWAQDLGEREGVNASDLRVFLVHVERAAIRQVAFKTPSNLPRVVSVLRLFGARVLRRLELASIADALRSDNEAARHAARPLALRCLTSSAMLHEADLDREMGALLVATMPGATTDERQQVLDALQPPSFEWMKNTEFEIARRAQWRRDRLALVVDYLPPREQGELSALTATEGKPEPLFVRSEMQVATYSARTSPLDDERLREMGLDKLLGYLDTWRPEGRRDTPSREGLSSRIQAMVAENPSKYANWAARFVGQHPTYVDGFLEGFRVAARNDASFSWSELLTLMIWVADQPPIDDMRDESGASGEHAAVSPHAPDWRRVKRITADLAGLALRPARDEPGALPWDERDRIWHVIATLAEDPNPTPAYELRSGESNMDPTHVAINTVRPEAIDAAVRFAYWSAQLRTRESTHLRDVLAAEPQVATLLERHLNPAVDPSLAVRASIGRWLTPLSRTDSDWVEAHLRDLLPESGDDASDEARRRDALWDAFTQWSQPHPDALAVLSSSYRAALGRVGRARTVRNADEADDRLAEHIVALYWWGAITLDTPDNLVAQLFDRADARRRAHALHHVGFSLNRHDGPVDAAVVARLERLWTWRASVLLAIRARGRDAVGVAAIASAGKELETFGTWFTSGAFDTKWALERLAEVLGAVGGVDFEHAAAERLSEVAQEYPKLAVACLLHVDYTGGAEPWKVRSWLECLPTVVGAVASSGDDEARRTAGDVINRVVAAGHSEYRYLLNELGQEREGDK
jgi:hypothetical protein